MIWLDSFLHEKIPFFWQILHYKYDLISRLFFNLNQNFFCLYLLFAGLSYNLYYILLWLINLLELRIKLIAYISTKKMLWKGHHHYHLATWLTFGNQKQTSYLYFAIDIRFMIILISFFSTKIDTTVELDWDINIKLYKCTRNLHHLRSVFALSQCTDVICFLSDQSSISLSVGFW